MKIRLRFELSQKDVATVTFINPQTLVKEKRPRVTLTFKQVDLPPEAGFERFWTKVDTHPVTGQPTPAFFEIQTDQVRLADLFTTGGQYDFDVCPTGKPGFPALTA
jgi:hypothetical protein